MGVHGLFRWPYLDFDCGNSTFSSSASAAHKRRWAMLLSCDDSLGGGGERYEEFKLEKGIQFHSSRILSKVITSLRDHLSFFSLGLHT